LGYTAKAHKAEAAFLLQYGQLEERINQGFYRESKENLKRSLRVLMVRKGIA
jgi:hypothetical protein